MTVITQLIKEKKYGELNDLSDSLGAENIIKEAIHLADAVFLQSIKENMIYLGFIHQFFLIDNEESKRLDFLLKTKAPETTRECLYQLETASAEMSPFTASVACIERHERKSSLERAGKDHYGAYNFNPVVLYGGSLKKANEVIAQDIQNKELHKMGKFATAIPVGHSQIFILPAEHWTLCQIFKNKDSIDIIYYNSTKKDGNFKKYKTAFERAGLTIKNVFFNSEIQQTDYESCNFMVLHMAEKITVADRYIEGGLLHYCKTQPIIMQTIVDDTIIKEIPFPNSLVRLTQSRDILKRQGWVRKKDSEDDEITEANLHLLSTPINKKGTTSFLPSYEMKNGKQQNHALKASIKKRAAHLQDFLSVHTDTEIRAMVSACVLPDVPQATEKSRPRFNEYNTTHIQFHKKR